MECPICNTIIDDTHKTPFCPTCHWELVVISSDVSSEMKRYFEDRQNAYRNCYSSIKNKRAMEQELEKLTNDHLALKQEISAAITTLQKKLEMLERMRSVPLELESTKSAKDSLQEEIERTRALATQTQNYQDDMEALKKAYEQVVHLGCADQVKNVKSFLRNKGIIIE